jgi:MFS transporter, PAT family, beta-lactamase induction signal transducer AmpG
MGLGSAAVDLAERRGLRLFALCALYVAQGIPWGFMATTLPAYLTQQGLDFAFVSGTLAFTVLPYTFKWVWGPIVDAFSWPRLGRRRPWILIAQTGMALTVIAMVTFDLTTEIRLLAAMVFIHTVFNALQDVAVDALAVDLLDDDERGRANGLMYASKYAGGALGGIGMATLIVWTSLDVALVAQTSVLVAIMLVPLLVRERAAGDLTGAARLSLREIVGGLAQAFSLRSNLVNALLVLAATFAAGMISATGYKLFISELGWTYDRYTAISGGWGLVVSGAAAAAGGWLSDRFGRRRVAAIASIAMAAGWVAFALVRPFWTETWVVYASGLYAGACLAILTVALIALCMDLSWPKIGGTQFTTYMALSNFSTALGYQFAARANELWEFHGVYLVAAAIQVAVTVLLWPIDPTETRRRLPLPPGTPLNRLGLLALGGLLIFLIGMTVRTALKTLG